MNTLDTTISKPSTKEKAQEIAEQWRNPRLGFHTEVIRKNFAYVVRLVINQTN